MDYRLELVPIPVSDVDRAKAFYAEKVGFCVDHDVNADTDQRVSDERRVVQLTPPGLPARSPSGSGSWARSPAPFRPYTWSSRT
jgi:catechol 2,3-dioxygenase-like lactoylglutathione lyase family enzyme